MSRKKIEISAVVPEIATPVPVDETDAEMEAQVQQSFSFIMERVVENISKANVEIGDHLFWTYYGGDPNSVESRCPLKPKTLKRLLKQPGFTLGQSTLAQILQTAVQTKVLKDNGIDVLKLIEQKKITYTHLVELCREKDLARKQVLLDMIVKENKSSREIAGIIRGDHPGAEPPELSLVVFDSLKKAIKEIAKDETIERFKSPDAMSEVEKRHYKTTLPDLIKQLGEAMTMCKAAHRKITKRASKASDPAEANAALQQMGA